MPAIRASTPGSLATLIESVDDARRLEPREVGPFEYLDKIPLKTGYEELGVRVADQRDHNGASFTHLHPKDIGGAILSIDAMEPFERWEWQLIRHVPVVRERTATHRTAAVSLRAVEADRTEVAVSVESGGRAEPRVAETAVNRLYDLVQTAATL